jgi:hypothetical protein
MVARKEVARQTTKLIGIETEADIESQRRLDFVLAAEYKFNAKLQSLRARYEADMKTLRGEFLQKVGME